MTPDLLNLRTVLDAVVLGAMNFWFICDAEISDPASASGLFLFALCSYVVGRQEQWRQCRKIAENKKDGPR